MVKGVNKTIIEVNETGNKYFERVLFFVKPDYADVLPERLKTKAATYIKESDLVPVAAVKSSAKKRKALPIAVLLAAVGVLALVVYFVI